MGKTQITSMIENNCLFSSNFKSLIMKMKNVLWVALVGVAVSCTVSKRIDRWGYRVSFDKKKQSELINEEVAAVPMTDENRSTLQVAENVPVVSLVETVRVEPTAEVNTPLVKADVVIKNNANQANAVAAVKLNKKAERIMAKLNANEAKTGDSNRAENWVYILLILLVPFGTTISMYLYEGSWTKRVTTNLILTLLCGLPGFIHALVVIFGNK
jgi:uncharacterized membrane protein YqaE (UPF0057 family)